jgi:hypothetical protein
MVVNGRRLGVCWPKGIASGRRCPFGCRPRRSTTCSSRSAYHLLSADLLFGKRSSFSRGPDPVAADRNKQALAAPETRTVPKLLRECTHDVLTMRSQCTLALVHCHEARAATNNLLFANGLVGSAALCRYLSPGVVSPGITPLSDDPSCHPCRNLPPAVIGMGVKLGVEHHMSRHPVLPLTRSTGVASDLGALLPSGNTSQGIARATGPDFIFPQSD